MRLAHRMDKDVLALVSRKEHCRLCRFHEFMFYANTVLSLAQRMVDVCRYGPPSPVNDVYSTLSHQAATGIRIGAWPVVPGDNYLDKWCGRFEYSDAKAEINRLMVERGKTLGQSSGRTSRKKYSSPICKPGDRPGKEDSKDASLDGRLRDSPGKALALSMLDAMEGENG